MSTTVVKSDASMKIAIIGMAFRFPGDLSDDQHFWQNLRDGRNLISRIDAARWATDRLQHPKRSEPGRSVTFSAGVLSNIDRFDPGFFGISPRETMWLDPQQRLLLELAWESMENAGVKPSTLAGSDCAVYVGISGLDYGMRFMDDMAAMNSHSMTGNTMSIAANRLSYVYDLHGPSLSVDTACSSSLVALHHACNALRNGETKTALVGGVNMLLHPYPFVGFTKASMLSANGQCRAFDASGDGYVRSEGGAVLLLKPLEAALADGDGVRGVILATGANADGGRKTAMTIPSTAGQTELMRAVLARSGLAAHDVDYIEAHGTGTSVGDPVEAKAIGEVYGQSRGAGMAPLPIGSVKTNLGHLEAASGMAGLVKAVLMLENATIPPSINFVTPNPNIDFAGLNITVANTLRPLSHPAERAAVVGVNSFGFGGANAHVLMQAAAPRPIKSPNTGEGVPPLLLSGKTPQALREVAGLYATLLHNHPERAYDIAYGAAHQRDRLDKQLALSASTPESMADGLFAFSQGETVARMVLEDTPAKPGAVAFVYSGNGSQWVGMGQKLLAQSPRFAAVIADLDVLMAQPAGFSLLTELKAEGTAARLDDTAVAQPLLFALQVAVTTLLREGGVEATAVTGHSVGEVAAAWAAGCLSLPQAIRVICARSAAQALTRGQGRMAAAEMSAEAALALIAAEGLNDITIAGYNSPKNITLSGPLPALEAMGRVLAPQRVFFRVLDLDYAFHSPFMDPIEGGLVESLRDLAPTAGSLAYVSTVTGGQLAGADLDATYWWRNVREPVQFASAIGTMAELGCTTFVEIGPHAILQRYIAESLTASGASGRAVTVLRRSDDSLARVEEAVLRVHLLSPVQQWAGLFPIAGQRLRLPTYPWQKERHWHPRTSEAYGLISRPVVHPLLGWRLKEVAAGWENALDPLTCPWLEDHRVGGAMVLPGAAYVEMAMAAGQAHFAVEGQSSVGVCALEELDIILPVVFDGDHGRSVRFELSVSDGRFQIRSRQRLTDDEWTLNAVGRLLRAASRHNPTPQIAALAEGDGSVAITKPAHYAMTHAIGLDYGPAFQGLLAGRRLGAVLNATLALPESVNEQGYVLHPARLDVCFQALLNFFRSAGDTAPSVVYLPIKIAALQTFSDQPVVALRAHLLRHSARSALADFELLDAEGGVVATLAGCRFRAAPLPQRSQAVAMTWRSVPHLKPLDSEQASVSLPAMASLLKHLRSWFSQAEPRLARTAHFQEVRPLFDALAVSFTYEAFVDLSARRADWLQEALIQPETMIAPEVRPFFQWLTSVLRQEGLLVTDQAGLWQLLPSDLPSAQTIWRTLVRDYATSLPELIIAARVGHHLAAILEGFRHGSHVTHDMMHSYQTEILQDASPTYEGSKQALWQSLSLVAENWPAHRTLRVLEVIGGGSGVAGGLTALLPANRLQVVLATTDSEVLIKLKAEHESHNGVVVAALEPEAFTLSADVALPTTYDVVIFHHWLHHAPQRSVVLTATQRLLAQGGLVMIAERYPDIAANFASGLDARWWQEGGDGQPRSRLLAPSAWENALIEQGFAGVETFREPASMAAPGGAYVVLAKPGENTMLAAEPVAVATWLMVTDARSVALTERLKRLLESQGQHVQVVARRGSGAAVFGPQDPLSAGIVLDEAIQTLGRVDHVVYLSGAASDEEGPIASSKTVESDGVIGAFHVVKALTDRQLRPRLWLVTAGGALLDGMVTDNPASMRAGALWGFGRVVMNEAPALQCTMIDVSLETTKGDAARRLQAELLSPDGETEIVLSPHGRFGVRVERASLTAPREISNKQATTPRFRLDFHVPGQLRNLLWLPIAVSPLGDDDIEVAVVATGMNFRDVMYVMGMLPDEAVEKGFAGASLGLEMSGVVSRVGRHVNEFAVGDAVLGFGSACYASHVVTQANALARKPDSWSFEAAATVPTVFFTVYYSLKHLANLQAGERVLIHGGAGGVGIAAIQLALHLGAEVFVTAGNEEKRDFVALLGADHVLDSRSLHFAEDILTLTNGEGVDVILNSLAGEAIRRNLKVLRPFGRFLELGKRDFFENTAIGLRPFKDNISYFGIDADQLLVSRPAMATRLFQEVMGLFREGVLFPLPYRLFSAARVVEAFRTMQQSRHIGKVVVTLQDAQVSIEQPAPLVTPLRLAKNSTWLVTGGVAGFGLASARWLAERGVGCLALLSRRGMETPGAAEAVAGLQALGASVQVFAGDVADREALAEVLATIRRTCPPLSGILHAAMVLDDAPITGLDRARWESVLHPKMLGALALHELTRDLPIDYFVLYSSVTTLLGNPGQANYVAANAGLERLAAYRRSLGLPGTSIAWGPIADVGVLARQQAVKEGLNNRLGTAALTSTEALALLDRLLSHDHGAVTVANFDWSVLSRLLASASAPRFMALRAPGGAVSQADEEDIHLLLDGKSPEDAAVVVRALVAREVAQILCIGADAIDMARPLNDMGLDSLMAVELALALERRFAIQLPSMLLGSNPNVERVTAFVVERLLGDDEDSPAVDSHQAALVALVEQHGSEFSDEIIADTVGEMRERSQPGRA